MMQEFLAIDRINANRCDTSINARHRYLRVLARYFCYFVHFLIFFRSLNILFVDPVTFRYLCIFLDPLRPSKKRKTEEISILFFLVLYFLQFPVVVAMATKKISL